jgi:tyrosyl-tRNA synthetase
VASQGTGGRGSGRQHLRGRRLISQGGVSVDGEKITEVNAEMQAGRTFLLQVGKRRFKRVTLQTDK